MDTGKPSPKIAEHKVQETLHFRYLKFLVIVHLKKLFRKVYQSMILPTGPLEDTPNPTKKEIPKQKLLVKGPFGIFQETLWVFPKIGGKPPKMDGENHGSKPYEQMDDLGGKGTPIFGLTPLWVRSLEPRYVAQHTAPRARWTTASPQGDVFLSRVFVAQRTLPETNSSPLKIGRLTSQEEMNHLKQPLIFNDYVSFREGKLFRFRILVEINFSKDFQKSLLPKSNLALGGDRLPAFCWPKTF